MVTVLEDVPTTGAGSFHAPDLPAFAGFPVPFLPCEIRVLFSFSLPPISVIYRLFYEMD
jgi:hypothetical protein